MGEEISDILQTPKNREGFKYGFAHTLNGVSQSGDSSMCLPDANSEVTPLLSLYYIWGQVKDNK